MSAERGWRQCVLLSTAAARISYHLVLLLASARASSVCSQFGYSLACLEQLSDEQFDEEVLVRLVDPRLHARAPHVLEDAAGRAEQQQALVGPVDGQLVRADTGRQVQRHTLGGSQRQLEHRVHLTHTAQHSQAGERSEASAAMEGGRMATAVVLEEVAVHLSHVLQPRVDVREHVACAPLELSIGHCAAGCNRGEGRSSKRQGHGCAVQRLAWPAESVVVADGVAVQS